MTVTYLETAVRGVQTRVPSVVIDGRTLIAKGRSVKVASVRDEELAEGELVKTPEAFVAELRNSGLPADVLTFFQRPPDVKPKFSDRVEWENYAMLPVTTFEEWWDKLPQESRKNTRRAAKRGVEVRVAQFDDELARGIHKICNESPVRQGKRFWHYGKDFETIKEEHATYLARSEFIGAYFENELIGFIKIVYVDRLAYILAIIALNSHFDKRPMNALLSKTLEVCVQKRVGWLVYGNYAYGNKKWDSLMEFKRRNGFERVDFPRYYIPLTWKGKAYVALRLYRGAVGLLPGPLLVFLLKVRDKFYTRKAKPETVKQEPAKDD